MPGEKGRPKQPHRRDRRRFIREKVGPDEDRSAVAMAHRLRVPHCRRDIEDGGLFTLFQLRFGGKADCKQVSGALQSDWGWRDAQPSVGGFAHGNDAFTTLFTTPVWFEVDNWVAYPSRSNICWLGPMGLLRCQPCLCQTRQTSYP